MSDPAMYARHCAVLLAVVGLAAAPVAAGADIGWSVVLDSDSCCCSGRGRGTFVVNNDLTQVTYNLELDLTSLTTEIHMHAPVLPGELPTEAPAALMLTGSFQHRDCGVNGSVRAARVCGTLSGASAIDPTIVGHMMDGLAWVVIHTDAFPMGETCGRIRFDVTTVRATSWGRIKILYR